MDPDMVERCAEWHRLDAKVKAERTELALLKEEFDRERSELVEHMLAHGLTKTRIALQGGMGGYYHLKEGRQRQSPTKKWLREMCFEYCQQHCTSTPEHFCQFLDDSRGYTSKGVDLVRGGIRAPAEPGDF